jgi:hypothetical protein
MTAVIWRFVGACHTLLVPIEIPLHPANPERICWGCEKYCPAEDLRCGNGTIRTPHSVELFGDDWVEWSGIEAVAAAESANAQPVNGR